MQRLVAGALLADGVSELHNISQSDDCTASLLVAAQLGAEIELGDGEVRITGTGGNLRPRVSELTPGESGLAGRMFTAIAGLSPEPLTVSAEKTLRGRPMSAFESAFNDLGAKLTCTEGTYPVFIQPKLTGGTCTLEGHTSSQFLTGLLFALPCGSQGSEITLDETVSKPYIQLTLEVLSDFGIEYSASDDMRHFECKGNQTYQPIQAVIDGDWSGAAALAVAGMLCADSAIEISGLDNVYTQADEAIRGALLFAGGALSGTDDGIQVARRPVRPFQVDLTESPDLFPVLAALAAHGKKPSILKGIHRLVHKESNRAQAIQAEWSKLGICVELNEMLDHMIVHPRPRHFAPSEVLHSHQDHRMVMAAALLGLAGEHPVEIEGIEAIAKSYPEFFDDLEVLGGKIAMMK